MIKNTVKVALGLFFNTLFWNAYGAVVPAEHSISRMLHCSSAIKEALTPFLIPILHDVVASYLFGDEWRPTKRVPHSHSTPYSSTGEKSIILNDGTFAWIGYEGSSKSDFVNFLDRDLQFKRAIPLMNLMSKDFEATLNMRSVALFSCGVLRLAYGRRDGHIRVLDISESDFKEAGVFARSAGGNLGRASETNLVVCCNNQADIYDMVKLQQVGTIEEESDQYLFQRVIQLSPAIYAALVTKRLVTPQRVDGPFLALYQKKSSLSGNIYEKHNTLKDYPANAILRLSDTAFVVVTGNNIGLWGTGSLTCQSTASYEGGEVQQMLMLSPETFAVSHAFSPEIGGIAISIWEGNNKKLQCQQKIEFDREGPDIMRSFILCSKNKFLSSLLKETIIWRRVG